ncbi:GIY-YIG nuclease family protein [Povalibacter sp.]|uniref:GIY-YIG nuclease family protein n=1 Tax=Povalibacter sp. TaxID=1962978 RepID=UPI002F400A64
MDHRDVISGHSLAWFVYLFALTDCSAFKVGFSNNPLQRIHTFSPRYFERFDLHQSLVLRLDSIDAARALEAELKQVLAQACIDCPSWVPREAGGFTEWFGAPQFGLAEERLRSIDALDGNLRLATAADFIRNELIHSSAAFEQWACRQAQLVCDAFAYASGTRQPFEALRPLRDWLDACRYLGIPLFADDPHAREFVMQTSRLPA